MTDTAPIVNGTEPEEPVVPVKDAGEFGPGSFAPATDALSLKDRLRQSSPQTDKVRSELQGVKGGTGRPRTRTAKPVAEDKDKAKTPDQLARERKGKKDRSDDIAQQITGEFNDVLMRFLISQGMPAAALYNEGHVPAPVSKNAARYTEIGAKLSVDDFTASMVGSFIVEFESSDLGSQLVAKTTGGPVGLVVKGLVAGACVVGYLNGVRQVLKQMEPVVAAYKEYQRNQGQNNRQGQTA